MRCGSRVASAQNWITKWALCFFYSFGGVICCFFKLFLLALTVEIAEISFQQTGDRAGLTNITVIMINLSLLRISSGFQPKWKKQMVLRLCSSVTWLTLVKELENFWHLVVSSSALHDWKPSVLEQFTVAADLSSSIIQLILLIIRLCLENAVCSFASKSVLL